jgi:hypothetical protein
MRITPTCLAPPELSPPASMLKRKTRSLAKLPLGEVKEMSKRCLSKSRISPCQSLSTPQPVNSLCTRKVSSRELIAMVALTTVWLLSDTLSREMVTVMAMVVSQKFARLPSGTTSANRRLPAVSPTRRATATTGRSRTPGAPGGAIMVSSASTSITTVPVAFAACINTPNSLRPSTTEHPT